MKNFSFKINFFSANFNQMSDGKNNIDSIIDERIRMSLKSETSGNFTPELLERIEIEKQFVREDVRTYKRVKYVIFGIISVIVIFLSIFTVVLSENEGSAESGLIARNIDRFSDIISSASVFMTENLGVTLSYQTGIFILLIMVFVFLFSFADKIIFKKGYK